MPTYATGTLSGTALPWIDTILVAADRRMRKTAQRLFAWIEKRRATEAAWLILNAMSERELRDIGLTRSDVQHMTWNATTRPEVREWIQ